MDKWCKGDGSPSGWRIVDDESDGVTFGKGWVAGHNPNGEQVGDISHFLEGSGNIQKIYMYPSTDQGDENLILDMDTLCHGHPVFELASMFNAYKGYAETDHSVTKAFLGIDYAAGAALWEKTLRLYLNEPDEQTLRAVEEKAMVVGYTRIMRRRIRRNGFASEEGCREIETCRNHLNELLPRADSLTF